MCFKYIFAWLLLFQSCIAHQPIKFLAEIKGQKNAPEKIYQAYCRNCHDSKPMIPLGAPRKGVQGDWLLRLKSPAKLLKHTYEGYLLMPARGGCFECTDEQLVQVIEYMTNYKKN
jgi:cytochrome c5